MNINVLPPIVNFTQYPVHIFWPTILPDHLVTSQIHRYQVSPFSIKSPTPQLTPANCTSYPVPFPIPQLSPLFWRPSRHWAPPREAHTHQHTWKHPHRAKGHYVFCAPFPAEHISCFPGSLPNAGTSYKPLTFPSPCTQLLWKHPQQNKVAPHSMWFTSHTKTLPAFIEVFCHHGNHGRHWPKQCSPYSPKSYLPALNCTQPFGLQFPRHKQACFPGCPPAPGTPVMWLLENP